MARTQSLDYLRGMPHAARNRDSLEKKAGPPDMVRLSDCMHTHSSGSNGFNCHILRRRHQLRRGNSRKPTHHLHRRRDGNLRHRARQDHPQHCRNLDRAITRDIYRKHPARGGLPCFNRGELAR